MKKYIFKNYSELFPLLFEKEKARLSATLPHLHIEHVGSTAVPQLGGKGIIDIALGADIESFPSISQILEQLGYEFRESGSTSDRYFFRADLPDPEEGTRRYHLHLMPFENKEWKQMLAFREYLRTHPEAAEEYAELKKSAAALAKEDGAAYRAIKEPFFKKSSI